MNQKTGILAVSFGTSHNTTRARTIQAIEQEIQAAWPDIPLFRAWTSGMIRKKLARTTGEIIPGVKEALAQMAEEGITRVVLQPTHVIDGIENQRMQEDAGAFTGVFQQIAFGRPLLSTMEDLTEAAGILADSFYFPDPGEHLILMGHGSAHSANQVYRQLETCFHKAGYSRIHVATVEASPSLSDVIEKLQGKNVTRVHLAPLMIVAGDHAVNDMAGEEPDSWQSVLTRCGYPVTCHLKGLGEYPEIRRMFLSHLEEALSVLKGD